MVANSTNFDQTLLNLKENWKVFEIIVIIRQFKPPN